MDKILQNESVFTAPSKTTDSLNEAEFNYFFGFVTYFTQSTLEKPGGRHAALNSSPTEQISVNFF